MLHPYHYLSLTSILHATQGALSASAHPSGVCAYAPIGIQRRICVLVTCAEERAGAMIWHTFSVNYCFAPIDQLHTIPPVIKYKIYVIFSCLIVRAWILFYLWFLQLQGTVTAGRAVRGIRNRPTLGNADRRCGLCVMGYQKATPRFLSFHVHSLPTLRDSVHLSTPPSTSPHLL